ncbi:hypothetical protein [Novosphingobium marinum]|uniref:Uncharacterized protein n=1 Tax=Novosphingobium marinum TaxID=1514948 RepID=A0A7Y9XTK7_9SPHN|nr:hypothetical protein [Novosphingobium marinum]NYH94331.1 hypothetical protein [Novosphingobium marinum]
MRLQTFDLMRVWAAITGITLALWYFFEVWSGVRPADLVPMLVAGIGGFELFLYGQDVWLKRKGRHG